MYGAGLCGAGHCKSYRAARAGTGRIEVRLSANILKNAMGVGIPGTGMVGLPIAIALGALIGKSSYGLEVLKDCTPEAVAEGKAYDEAGHIQISLAEDAPDKLFVEVKAIAGENHGTAAIARQHTNFILEKKGRRCYSKSSWEP